MNRRGAIITTLAIIAALVVGGGFAADYALKSTIGLGLMDLYEVFKEATITNEDALTLEDVKTQIGISSYNDLKAEQGNMSQAFSLAAEQLEAINSNQELSSVLNAALGEDYKIYLFSITNISDLQFKVFEWSIRVNNGNITDFKSGRVYNDYNVNIQVDHTIAYDLLQGQADTSLVVDWIKDNKIKLSPVNEVLRVPRALPQIITAVQAYI